MPDEVSWEELSGLIGSGVLPPVQEAPNVIGSATAEILAQIYTEPQWYVVRRTLEHLQANDSIAQILAATPGALTAASAAFEALRARFSEVDAGPSPVDAELSSPEPLSPASSQGVLFGDPPLPDALLPDAPPPDTEAAARRLEAELAQAEADLRRRLPQISARLSLVEKAADEISTDPETRKLVERIAGTVKRQAGSRLSPVALLVGLWWLFVVVFPKDAPTDVAVLALWYAVARDSWKKGD